jgi:hypothetical protein
MKMNRSSAMRSRSIRRLVAAVIVAGGLCVLAEQPLLAQPQPATMPNPAPPTQPPATAEQAPTSPPAPASTQVVPINTNSPRGALKTLLTAIQSGDPEGIKKVIHTNTPLEAKMVEALGHRAVAENKFREAAIKAFGADEAKQLVGDAEASNAVNMSQLDQAAETIEGDKATVSSGAGAGEPVMLTKVGDQWRIPASEFSKDSDPVRIQQNIEDMDFAAGLIEQFASDVASGKFKNAEEAGESIQLQMRAAMEKYAMQRAAGGAGGATTMPAPAATGPSSGPG